MNEDEQHALQEKHKAETRAMMRRILVIGGIKLLLLSIVSAAFVTWYMF